MIELRWIVPETLSSKEAILQYRANWPVYCLDGTAAGIEYGDWKNITTVVLPQERYDAFAKG